jgi:hypothetical protein
MTDILIAILGIAFIAAASLAYQHDTRKADDALALGDISVHVWRRRIRLANVWYLAILATLLFLAAIWGDLR